MNKLNKVLLTSVSISGLLISTQALAVRYDINASNFDANAGADQTAAANAAATKIQAVYKGYNVRKTSAKVPQRMPANTTNTAIVPISKDTTTTDISKAKFFKLLRVASRTNPSLDKVYNAVKNAQGLNTTKHDMEIYRQLMQLLSKTSQVKTSNSNGNSSLPLTNEAHNAKIDNLGRAGLNTMLQNKSNGIIPNVVQDSYNVVGQILAAAPHNNMITSSNTQVFIEKTKEMLEIVDDNNIDYETLENLLRSKLNPDQYSSFFKLIDAMKERKNFNSKEELIAFLTETTPTLAQAEAEELNKAIAESKKTLHNDIQKLVATEISEDLALEINNAKVSNEEIAAQLNPTAALSAARGEVTGSVANALDQAAARTAMAAGAGAENIDYGVWAQANLGRAKQKTLKGFNGYKSLSKGATIGLDAKLNDKDMIGMSVSINNNDIKINKATKGNKLKVDSYQLVAYGSHKTDDQFVVSGFVNGGINEVNSVSVRSLNNPIKAKAKYKIYNTGLGLKLGKIFNIAESTTLTPDVGVEYAKLFQKSYTEKNAGITTQHVSSNESDYTRVSAGLKLARKVALDNAIVTPEIHARAFRDMSHGTDKFTARFEGMNATTVKGAKAAKEGYNLGTSVTVASGKMDFSVNYDATFKKKYERHEGSMKVKINL